MHQYSTFILWYSDVMYGWMDEWVDGCIHTYIHTSIDPSIHPSIHTEFSQIDGFWGLKIGSELASWFPVDRCWSFRWNWLVSDGHSGWCDRDWFRAFAGKQETHWRQATRAAQWVWSNFGPHIPAHWAGGASSFRVKWWPFSDFLLSFG